ncbi:uncharacterized protein PGTG_10958 [Puccinia graminis f. sp. tritici CRL 75-36-700-3]|uniref:Secreted protein n=1 Tax=Puccinia graminis f. sp. tritici (strain CRL 75-36-700-3 / race SCCL) TaxID=418459 RepID=E3KMZ3_PUCGT|nr:uncharacterized protein PGTG_10958 [Puccinia graminis f. sp. tritici CRL 75-36-700-3]EFP85629.2 hypothetical protein PGTG_10958 [Puccinia graminis f. sp. tritici CRL 75-36-700-3]
MSFMNLFQGGYITFALLALIIALHSGQADAVATRTTRQCGYHFGPNDRYVQKAYEYPGSLMLVRQLLERFD